MASVVVGCSAVVAGWSSPTRPRSLAEASAASEREGPGRLDAGGGPGTSVAWTSPPAGCGNARVTSGGTWCAGPGNSNRPASATVVDATVTGEPPVIGGSGIGGSCIGGSGIGGSCMASVAWVGRAPSAV